MVTAGDKNRGAAAAAVTSSTARGRRRAAGERHVVREMSTSLGDGPRHVSGGHRYGVC